MYDGLNKKRLLILIALFVDGFLITNKIKSFLKENEIENNLQEKIN